MDLDQLRLFVDLVREQNFTKVAELNCVTQPAVSLSIQRLEEELGTKLLERTTRKVLVTEEGRLVFEHAREILNQAAEIKHVLQERQEKVLGTVRLASVHTVGLYELPASLKEFLRRFPEVTLHIEYRLSEQVYQSVAAGEADLGLVAYPEERTGLVCVPFLEDEMVVICSNDHPFADKKSLPLAALDGIPFVTFEPGIPTRRAIDALFHEHGIHPDVRMQCDNIEILKRMVEIGMGVSLVPALSVRAEARVGGLRVITVADHKMMRPVAIVRRKGKSLSRAHQALLDLLVEEGAELLRKDLK